MIEILGFLRKAWPFLILAAVAAYVGVLRHENSGLKDKLQSERDFRTSLQTILHSKKNDKPVLLTDVRAALQTSENRRQTLETIGQQALKDKQRADASDAALARTQAENNQRYAAASKRIDQLEHRPSTVEEDSKAAWEGWK